MTGRQVADLFGVDPKTVIRWANSGRIDRASPPGAGPSLYRRVDVEQLLERDESDA